MNIADPKIQKNLSVITQNTNRLLALTGQLLDFQKIGAHKFEMTLEYVDITALLRETVARFEPTISKKNKELTLDIPEEPIEAVVDKEAITKILSNLLNNALKYARRSICVELQKTADAFLVRVTSDGEKIPTEISQQIFEPFYQAAKKTPLPLESASVFRWHVHWHLSIKVSCIWIRNTEIIHLYCRFL